MAFRIRRIDSVIADERISHGDDLSAIRRIGQNLLVSRHRGIEANLSHPRARCAKGSAFEASAIFESKDCAHSRAVSLVQRDFQLSRKQKKKPEPFWFGLLKYYPTRAV